MTAMSKDQARKTNMSRKRKVWVIRLVTGEEYECFVKEKENAIAYARNRGLKVDKVYLAKKERWTK